MFKMGSFEKHGFLPFVRNISTTLKYKKQKNDNGEYIFNEKGKIKRKIEKKPRPICYASHFDSLIYSWIGFLLSKKYDDLLTQEGLDKCVLAYRRIEKIVDDEELGKSNIDFAKEAFDEIKNRKNCVAMAFDIKSFFDTLSHTHLKICWRKFFSLPNDYYPVLKSLIKFRFVERSEAMKLFGINPKTAKAICPFEELRNAVQTKKIKIHKNEEEEKKGFDDINIGIPQGSPISGVLANIYMTEFDKTIHDFLQSRGGSYRRYSDDMLVICDAQYKGEVMKKMTEEIAKYHLKISEDKTELVEFYEDNGTIKIDQSDSKSNRPALQYLGFEFDGKKILIRASSMARFYRKMKSAVHAAAIRASKNPKDKTIWKDRLYKKFTHLGKQNFISYAKKAFRDIMKIDSIKKQISRYWKILHKEIDKRSGRIKY